MQSSNLLPTLQELPGGESGQQKPFRDHITDLVSMDRAMYAAEFASAASAGLWFIFDERSVRGINIPGTGINVDDRLFEAYEAQYPGLAADHSLYEQWQDMLGRSSDSMEGFINELKGKVAEFNTKEILEQNGFTNVTIAADPTQAVLDISAVSTDGEEVLIQVKTGAADYASEVQGLMAENPGIHFAVSTKIYEQVAGSAMNTMDRLRNIGSNELLTEKVGQNLDALVSDPDSLDDRVRETMTQAYKMAFKDVAESQTLSERWQEMIERGDESMKNFISPLKGKMAEIDFAEQLEETGSTVSIHPDPTQPISDITETTPDGVTRLWQVKSYVEENAYKVEAVMSENQDINYAVSMEVYNHIAEPALDTADRLTDIGTGYLLVEGINDGLDTLSGNMGLDIPDGVVDLVPYAAAIFAASRLLMSVIKTEKEFKAANRTTKNKIQVVQTLTLMSRMGITTVCAAGGVTAGGLAGSFLPGIGNLIGGIGGSIVGAGAGMYLNSHLQPHMLNLALDITGLTNDDLFYYKNKPRIDTVAWSFQATARELAAVPA